MIESSLRRAERTGVEGSRAVLRGTLTLLADDGFTSDESLEWLYTLQEELGERPIDALVSGRHHRVNRIASTLAF